MEKHDTIAQNLAMIFEQCGHLDPAFEIANFCASEGGLNFVLCIDKMGINRSKAFPVSDDNEVDQEYYFEKECPPASECSFKFNVWAT